jgi:DUF4097 and DUF4098 domain-containing protein YvlB
MLLRRSILVAVPALLFGAAPPAVAQDVRVEVVVPVLIRDVQRIVHQALDADIVRQIQREITQEIVARQRRGGASQREAFTVEREARETRTLRIGADGALDLSTVSGDVTVTAGGGQSASVEIHRVSRGRTEADAARGLELVTVEVTERGPRASVEARYPSERNPPFSVSVSYTVTAPANTRLSIKTIAGAVSTKGIKGDQTIDVVSGNVNVAGGGPIATAKTIAGTVTLTAVETDGRVEASSTAGSVVLRDVKARRVSASVVTGTISATNVACTEADLTSMAGAVEFEGPLAARGRYNVQSYSGIIRFTALGRIGFDLRAESFAGPITVDPPLPQPTTQPAATIRRSSVRRMVGDGDAAVTLQSFSGPIVVVKK